MKKGIIESLSNRSYLTIQGLFLLLLFFAFFYGEGVFVDFL